METDIVVLGISACIKKPEELCDEVLMLHRKMETMGADPELLELLKRAYRYYTFLRDMAWGICMYLK